MKMLAVENVLLLKSWIEMQKVQEASQHQGPPPINNTQARLTSEITNTLRSRLIRPLLVEARPPSCNPRFGSIREA